MAKPDVAVLAPARRTPSPATLVWVRRAIIVALVVVAFALPRVVGQPYILQIIILAITYAIPAIGLNLMLGYTGLLSIGHMSIAGIGGYCAAVLMVDLGLNFWAALFAGTALAGAVGLLIGLTCLHLRSHFFLIVTLATSMVLFTVFNNWDSVTRGAEGFPGIPRPAPFSLLGTTFEFRTLPGFYVLSVVALVFIMIVQSAVVNSDFGRTLRAIRQDEALSVARGVNVTAYKIAVFALGSAIAGFGGVFKVSFLRVAVPLTFDVQESINLALIVIAGGAGFQAGPILGSALFIGLPEYLRLARAYRLVLFGLVLVVMTLTLPNGIAGVLAGWARKLGGKKLRDAS